MQKINLAVLILLACSLAASCNQSQEKDTQPQNTFERAPSMASVKEDLTQRGFEIFDYVDQATGDTVIMQKYFIAFLKTGPNRDQSQEVADSLQTLHMEHLGNMYELGYADISGPFDQDGDIRGITIYNVPNKQMADSLANADPSVQAGRLLIEIHPWWAAKGFSLR